MDAAVCEKILDMLGEQLEIKPKDTDKLRKSMSSIQEEIEAALQKSKRTSNRNQIRLIVESMNVQAAQLSVKYKRADYDKFLSANDMLLRCMRYELRDAKEFNDRYTPSFSSTESGAINIEQLANYKKGARKAHYNLQQQMESMRWLGYAET